MEKPKFDPTKPFEAASKPKFDPALPFEAPEAPPQKHSYADTALRGAASGASLGFSDELAGAAGNVAGKLGLVPDMGYDYYRDYTRGQDKEAAAENPKTFLGSKIGGTVATAFVPGLGAVNAAGKGLKGAALLGAGQGAVMGAGDSENNLASTAGLWDIGTGAALGGAGGAAGYGVGQAITGAPAVAKSLRDSAKRYAGRALGAERGTLKSLGEDAVNEAGGHALDKKILTLFGGTDDKIARNAAAQSQAGAAQKGVYDQLDAYGPSSFNPLDVATKVEDKVGGYWRSPINRGETKQLENTLESITMRGDKGIPLADAQVLKQELGKVANWKNTLNPTDKERMARDAYGVVAGEITNAADQGAKAIGVEGLAETLKAANKTYGASKTAEKLFENKAAREAGNKLMGLTDWTLAAGSIPAAMAGPAGAPLMLGGLAVKKLAEKFGPQAAAIGLNTASKGLQGVNTFLGSAAAPIATTTQVVGRAASPWMNMKERKK